MVPNRATHHIYDGALSRKHYFRKRAASFMFERVLSTSLECLIIIENRKFKQSPRTFLRNKIL